jgi:hypothetical protein
LPAAHFERNEAQGIRTAKEQKSISPKKRAEAGYAEYRSKRESFRAKTVSDAEPSRAFGQRLVGSDPAPVSAE